MSRAVPVHSGCFANVCGGNSSGEWVLPGDEDCSKFFVALWLGHTQWEGRNAVEMTKYGGEKYRNILQNLLLALGVFLS